MKNTFKTPILLITYNKPHETARVLKIINKVNPESLYVVSDKWKNEEDKKNVLKVRKLISKNIKYKFSLKYNNKNMGCKNGVVGAINWFFKNEKYGIIIEDDCLPDKSFFKYCETLLLKYENDQRVFSISGSNPININNHEDDYYFSKYIRIWGWATWRRSWEKYDSEIKNWIDIKNNKKHYSFFTTKKEALFWEKIWDKCYKEEIDTWDYQLFLAKLLSNGLTIVPTKNLISNIGFGENATHTKFDIHGISNYHTNKMVFPIKHPEHIFEDKILDQKFKKILISSKIRIVLNYLIRIIKK